MRAQTTLEFVILLSAIAAFGSLAIGTYAGVLGKQKAAYGSIINNTTATASAPTYASGSPFLYASMPSISYLNRSNPLQVIVALPVGATLTSLKAVGAEQYGIVPSAYYNISAPGTEILPFSIVPSVQGPVSVNMSAEIAYANGTLARNLTAVSFAVPQGTDTAALADGGFSAMIARHNESVLYGISNATPVYEAKMWSHCSAINGAGGQFPLQWQCGNANWYFFGFDTTCYWNDGGRPITYCVELVPTNTSSRQVQYQQSYAYNVTLALFNGGADLYSDLNSTDPESQVFGSGGKDYGIADVEGVSGDGGLGYGDLMMLNNTQKEWQANMSEYDAYQQALNNLISTMEYYNNTGGDPGAAAQDISGLNTTALKLTLQGTQSGNGNCSVVGNAVWHYACKPAYPLYYSIDARLNISGLSNQVLSVQGSTVNVT
jgi:hypothetical protein